MNKKDLLDKRAALETELDGMIEKAGTEKRSHLNADETKRSTEIEAEIKGIDEAVALLERRKALAIARGETDKDEKDERGNPRVEVISDPSEKPFSGLGDQLLAVRQATVVARTGQGEIDKRLFHADAMAAKASAKRGTPSGYNESTDSEGGFRVQMDVSTELLRNIYETGILASRARGLTISSNSNGMKINAIDETSRANGSRQGGVQVFMKHEADQYVSSKTKFREIEVKLNKMTGLYYATEEILEDAVALESDVTPLMSEEFGFKLDDLIVWGLGAGEPQGFMKSPAAVQVAKASAQAADTILLDNIVAMRSQMPVRSRKTMVWLYNQELEPQLHQLTWSTGGSTSQPVLWPQGGISGLPYDTIYGAPAFPIEQAAAPGDIGDFMLVDLSKYLLARKGAMKTDVSMHVRFLYDELAYKFSIRVDGQTIPNAGITPYKGTKKLSPFLYLEAR